VRERGPGDLGRYASAELLDQTNEVVAPVPVPAGELHELSGSSDHCPALQAPRNTDPSAASKLEQTLVAKRAKRAQNRVRINADHGGEIAGGRQTLARLGLAVGYRAANLGGDLLVQVGGIATVDLDWKHGASHTSAMSSVQAPQNSPDQDELEALIEEARRRARRRRLGYAALLVGMVAGASGIYLIFGGGGGTGGGPTLHGQSGAGGGAGPNSARPASASRESVYQHRCPGRGLDALPLTNAGNSFARSLARGNVGASPRITVRIRPATDAGARGSEVAWMCGPKVARRTLVAFTWDHRFDHGPNASASLAQHVCLISRFDDGYHLWQILH
jgi:hypothetical protein